MVSRRKLKVFCIGDVHAPFTDIKALEQIYDSIENHAPHIVIQMGDLYDRFAMSRFAYSRNVMRPKDEIEEGRELARNMWKTVHEIVPRARKIQIRGNHDDRLLKQTAERFPEILSIIQKADLDLMKFKNVESIEDSKSEFEIEGVIYTHGWMTQLGAHTKYLLKPVVHGHSHRGGSVFYNTHHGLLWELDCGFVASEADIPLQYGATKTTNWVKGFGIVDADGPRFVPIHK